jgi:hypothetical protein
MITDLSIPSELRTFRARQIATPLADATAVELHEKPGDALEKLAGGRFDQAPVLTQNHVFGWILTKNLQGAQSVKAITCPLSASAIVSAAATVADVLDLLGKNGLVFTLEESGLSGLVTPSDLDRHAVRGHFYLLIAALEMALAAIVGLTVSEEKIIARIHNDQRIRWDEASEIGKETMPVEYLYLKDLATLFLLSEAANKVPYSWEPALTQLCQLRTAVMHPAKPLLGKKTPHELALLARQGEELLDQLRQITVAIGPGPH